MISLGIHDDWQPSYNYDAHAVNASGVPLAIAARALDYAARLVDMGEGVVVQIPSAELQTRANSPYGRNFRQLTVPTELGSVTMRHYSNGIVHAGINRRSLRTAALADSFLPDVVFTSPGAKPVVINVPQLPLAKKELGRALDVASSVWRPISEVINTMQRADILGRYGY